MALTTLMCLLLRLCQTLCGRVCAIQLLGSSARSAPCVVSALARWHVQSRLHVCRGLGTSMGGVTMPSAVLGSPWYIAALLNLVSH